MPLYKGTRRVKKLYHGTQLKTCLIHRGRQIWPCRKFYKPPPLDIRMVTDSTGFWMEVGFRVWEELSGTAATGWTGGRGLVSCQLQVSTDLQTWTEGLYEDCAETAIENEDGTWDYWSRCTVPVYWHDIMVDLSLSSDRYGKSITAIKAKGGDVTLSGFPYAMPSDASRLQADLRTAGYTGAVVSSTSGTLTATAKNHTVDGTFMLDVTMSGSNVTDVAYRGVTISLAGYPYAMPSQRAALQTALRSAGQTGAVVKLHADTWQITLPDVVTVDTIRDFQCVFTPGDPCPYWDGFQVYQGELPDAVALGAHGNVRDPYGNPLLENNKAFARMKFHSTTP